MGCKKQYQRNRRRSQLIREENIQTNPYEDPVVNVQVFKVNTLNHNGIRAWGYNTNLNGSLYIHQPNVPAVMENNGFNSEAAAKKPAISWPAKSVKYYSAISYTRRT
ncbi:MAG: DUF4907 domain-containing protein [Bacteroidetes bacterium]|nr:DUF4907 domain-containing protein [Bacteroidota bacterium]